MRVRVQSDEGSALLMALVVIGAVALMLGSMIGLVQTNVLSAGQLHGLTDRQYAAEGALDGATQSLETSTTGGYGDDTTCFTLPAGSVNSAGALAVRCQGAPTSRMGVPDPTVSPVQSVLGLGAVGTSDGVQVNAGTNRVSGRVTAATLAVTSGAPSDSPNRLDAGPYPVTATTCAPGSPSNVTPVPVCSGALLVDPAYPQPTGPGLNKASPITPPACSATPVLQLLPGTYTSAAALRTAIACANGRVSAPAYPAQVIQFTPGVYYLDFSDAGSHAVDLAPTANTVVVGGAAAGWTPGTTAPAAVPVPTVASPAASACNQASAGVTFVFYDDSQLQATLGSVQLCAYNVSSPGQRIVMYGVPTTPATTKTYVALNPATTYTGGANWALSTGSLPATASIAKTTSSTLDVSGYSSGMPSNATVTAVHVQLQQVANGTAKNQAGKVKITVTGSGTVDPSHIAVDCKIVTCDGATPMTYQYDITGLSLSPAGLSGLHAQVLLDNTAAGNGTNTFSDVVQSLKLTVDYTVPPSGLTGSNILPYTGGGGGTAIFNASGSAVVAIHGTIYAPNGAVDLSETSAPTTVVDRGIIARHVTLGVTMAATVTAPVVSAAPTYPKYTPRQVYLSVTVNGGFVARAMVMFTDAAGVYDGTVPRVLSWTWP